MTHHRESELDIEGNLERVRYFTGQLLSVEDLQQEQQYLLARLRRHNRFLHGWGVVGGLDVSLESPEQVRVKPGLAIDCAGNEIVVAAETRLSLTGLVVPQFVAVAYAETAVKPMPAVGGDVEFTRTREEAQVVLLPVNPSARHGARWPGTPGCGLAHAVCIASVKPHRTGWKVQRRGR